MVRLALALVLASLAVCGCSSSQRELDLVPAVNRTESEGSARFALHGESAEAGNRVRTSCDGVVDYVRRRARISCEIGNAFGFQMIGIGDVSYVRASGKLAGLTGGKWQQDSDTGGSIQDLTPSKLLEMLRGAAVGSEHVGSDAVRGVSTEHYRLTVDRKKAQLDISGGRKTAEVDVWIDDDGLLRRVAADDGGPFTAEFFDFGTPVNVEPPPASEIEKPEQAVRPAPLPPCGGVEAAPITVQEALGALRRAGFSIDAKDQSCGMSPVAMIISNLSATTTTNAATAREGQLTCILLRRTPGSTPTVVVPTGSEANLHLANLNCSLGVVGNNPDVASKVARLRHAFADLRRTIHS